MIVWSPRGADWLDFWKVTNTSVFSAALQITAPSDETNQVVAHGQTVL